MSAEATEVTQQPQAAAAPPSAVENVTTVVAKFDRVAAGIGELKTKFAGVLFEVATTKGMKQACEARAAIREPRYEVERVRKECKAPILALGKDIDARAAKIEAELLALEAPIDAQIKAEETRKEQEKKRKAEAERRRIAEIEARMNAIRDWPLECISAGAALIEQKLRHANDYVIQPEVFQEFLPLAQKALLGSRDTLAKMLTERQAHDAEQERLRLEREELARNTAEAEAANAKERERIAAEQAEAKRKADAAEAERQRNIEAIMAKMKADREALEREQQLAEARMGEISAMAHQVIIATTGRAGVRVGGTRGCIIETLDETRAWEVTEEKFGPLYQMALTARKNACGAIADVLLQWDARAASERLADERANADLARTQLEGDFTVAYEVVEIPAAGDVYVPAALPQLKATDVGPAAAPRAQLKNEEAERMLAEAQLLLGIPVIFTRYELSALAASPDALQALIDYHDYQSACAEAADYAECCPSHDARIAELKAQQTAAAAKRQKEIDG